MGFDKRGLTFRTPLMNAAGSLGFAPDLHAPIPWDRLGAFVTNPLSLRPRRAAAQPAMLEYPGGFLLHTGLPNPGFHAAVKKYGASWKNAPLPVIIHIMADRPEETSQIVQILEGMENIAAAELGFAPLLADDILMITLEMCLGELPLIFSLPHEQVLSLGPRLVEGGAAAISMAPRRGALSHPGGMVAGRLFGPSLFPISFELVLAAARLGIPLIGSGGVYSLENANAMLEAGALAVQMDSALWKHWPG